MKNKILSFTVKIKQYIILRIRKFIVVFILFCVTDLWNSKNAIESIKYFYYFFLIIIVVF